MFRREIICAAASAALLLSTGFAHAADSAENSNYDPKYPFPVPGKVTVVDFGASWCASCPEMEALMKEMQKEYGDRAAFVTIDIDKWRGIEDIFLIDQMPAQIFYDAKGEPIWKHTGSVDADTMRERVNILIEGSKSLISAGIEPQ